MYPIQKIVTLGSIVFGALAIVANAFAESSSVQANERAALKAQLAEPWTPPVMKKSATAPVKKRQAKTKIKYGASDRALEEVPENAAFKRIDYLPEPLVPTTESTHIEQQTRSQSLQHGKLKPKRYYVSRRGTWIAEIF